MARLTAHTHLYSFPFSHDIFDSQIERLVERSGRRSTTDVMVDLLGLRAHGTGEWLIAEGRVWEVVRGVQVPLRLRFTHARWVRRTGAFTDLDRAAADHPARRLFDIVHIRPSRSDPQYWFYTDANLLGDSLLLKADGCVLEARPGAEREVTVRRRWARRPLNLSRLVPRPVALHRVYGGDPVAIRLGRRLYRRRLFIGGIRHQSAERPRVDHVLNLCGQPNPWLAIHGAHPADRHARKGELADGMTAEDLWAEGTRIADRLRAGERVLVHCAAGVNRSSTVCCAALIALEGLSAEEALARVREQHPDAAPDPYYWLLLRWLSRERAVGLEPAQEAMTDAPALREAAAIS